MSFELSSDYRQWLQQLKSQFQHTQQNAVRAVNTEMLKFYWQLGEQIVEQQQNYAWGDGFLKQLSHDLMMEFPEMKGFSKRNLEYIRRWYLFWSKDMSIAQQVVAQLGHPGTHERISSWPAGSARIVRPCQGTPLAGRRTDGQ